MYLTGLPRLMAGPVSVRSFGYWDGKIAVYWVYLPSSTLKKYFFLDWWEKKKAICRFIIKAGNFISLLHIITTLNLLFQNLFYKLLTKSLIVIQN